MLKRIFSISLFLISCFLFMHCEKEVAAPQQEFHAAFAASETALEDAMNISRTFRNTGKLPFSTINCPVSVDTLADGSFSFSFSPTCKTGDNRFRSGKLIVHPPQSDGVVVDLIHYSIFTDSSFALLGTIKYSADLSFNPYFKINSQSDFHVFKLNLNKEIFSAQVNHERELLEGTGTPSVADDVISKSGKGTYTLPDGKQWSMNYSSPATKRLTIGCIDFVTGQAIFSSGKGSSLLFDWGGGTCDNRYTITISEQTTIHNIP